MGKFIVDSPEISDVEKAIKEHGVESVYWLVDSTRAKEGLRLGLTRSQMLAIQTLRDMETALSILGEGYESCGCHTAPAPKPKAKKSAKKTEE